MSLLGYSFLPFLLLLFWANTLVSGYQCICIPFDIAFKHAVPWCVLKYQEETWKLMEDDVQLFLCFWRNFLHDILRNVCSHFSCTYQVENKMEGCSILFTTCLHAPPFSFNRDRTSRRLCQGRSLMSSPEADGFRWIRSRWNAVLSLCWCLRGNAAAAAPQSLRVFPLGSL